MRRGLEGNRVDSVFEMASTNEIAAAKSAATRRTLAMTGAMGRQVYMCTLMYIGVGFKYFLLKSLLHNIFSPRNNVHQCTHVHLEGGKGWFEGVFGRFLGILGWFLVYVCMFMYITKSKAAAFVMPGVRRVILVYVAISRCTPMYTWKMEVMR